MSLVRTAIVMTFACGLSVSAGQWTRVSSMIVARELHTATRLADGRVIVAGGYDNSQHVLHASCEVFIP